MYVVKVYNDDGSVEIYCAVSQTLARTWLEGAWAMGADFDFCYIPDPEDEV